MVKLNILNMKEFLKAVNECTGPVYLLSADGKKVNIHKNEAVQLDLQSKHTTNNRNLSLSLDIPGGKDYMNLVIFSVSDY